MSAPAAAPPAAPSAPPDKKRDHFASLSEEAKEAIRAKQRAAKAKKTRAGGCVEAAAAERSSADAGAEADYPTELSRDTYFAACPRMRFADDDLAANAASLELLMRLVDDNAVIGRDRRGTEVRLSEFQYFIFAGTDQQKWDPTFFARLAFEGFFTITQGSRRGTGEPLPELQPYYGVVDWENLNKAKHIRKALRKVKTQDCAADGSCKYYLYNNVDLDGSYQELDRYQRQHNGCNWMTRQYFLTAKKASEDPQINFKFHSVEMYDGPLQAERKPKLIAGEIGFSIGQVYTSLSGFCDTSLSGAGTVQLACLGKWLESKGYAFWSLGHCYSPEMEYKRQLGHRIYTRAQFLQKVRQHRGQFFTEGKPLALAGFSPLADGERCDIAALLGAA